MGFKALKYGSRFCFLWDLHPAKDWGSELGRTLLPVQIPAWMNSLPLALAELCYSHPPIPGHQSHRITFLVPLEISVLTPCSQGKSARARGTALGWARAGLDGILGKILPGTSGQVLAQLPRGWWSLHSCRDLKLCACGTWGHSQW